LDRTERQAGYLWVTAASNGDELSKSRLGVELLAPTEWAGATSLPELLAAFVLPNHPALVPVLGAAGERLRDETGDSALSGYQSKSRERVGSITRAIYNAVQARGVTYVSPPASFETSGQKIVSVHRNASMT